MNKEYLYQFNSP